MANNSKIHRWHDNFQVEDVDLGKVIEFLGKVQEQILRLLLREGGVQGSTLFFSYNLEWRERGWNEKEQDET